MGKINRFCASEKPVKKDENGMWKFLTTPTSITILGPQNKEGNLSQ
jgi:hypothetical protein